MRRCFTFPQPSTPSTAPSPHNPELPTPHNSPSGELDPRSPTALTITSSEYERTVQTLSFKEIWAKIHDHQPQESGPPTPPPSPLVSAVLQPGRASIDEALHSARCSNLTRLASGYFDKSELASRLCIDLQSSIYHVRSRYFPLYSVLEILPDSANRLSPAQCDCVFKTLLEFDSSENPFHSPPDPQFDETRTFFKDLNIQLQSLRDKAWRKGVLIRRVTNGSAMCLIGTTVGLVVAGFVIATHGLAALAAGPIAFLQGPGDLLAGRRRRVREEVKLLDAAIQGTVVGEYLQTIRCLVTALQSSVDSDKSAVSLGLRLGSERHAMEEVVKHLRKNQETLEKRITDLEEHVCICCAAVNRARSLLLDHFLHHHRSRNR